MIDTQRLDTRCMLRRFLDNEPSIRLEIIYDTRTKEFLIYSRSTGKYCQGRLSPPEELVNYIEGVAKDKVVEIIMEYI
jgi:hypothetical protein